MQIVNWWTATRYKECSVSHIPCVIYSVSISLFANVTHWWIHPSWHKFKKSIAVYIGLLHMQLLTSSHLQFLIIVEFATIQILLCLSITCVQYFLTRCSAILSVGTPFHWRDHVLHIKNYHTTNLFARMQFLVTVSLHINPHE